MLHDPLNQEHLLIFSDCGHCKFLRHPIPAKIHAQAKYEAALTQMSTLGCSENWPMITPL